MPYLIQSKSFGLKLFPNNPDSVSDICILSNNQDNYESLKNKLLEKKVSVSKEINPNKTNVLVFLLDKINLDGLSSVRYNIEIFEHIQTILSKTSNIKKILFLNLLSNNSKEIWSLGLGSFVKTLGLEYPDMQCVYCDISDVSLDSLSSDDTIRLLNTNNIKNVLTFNSDGSVWTETLKPYQSNESSDYILNNNDTVLVVGGARGITYECIVALAKSIKLNFVIIGRTSLETNRQYQEKENETVLIKEIIQDYKSRNEKPPSPVILKNQAKAYINSQSVIRNIEKLKQDALSVSYYDIDVTNADSVKRLIHEVNEKYGKIDGLVYGAGVILDDLIKNKSLEKFTTVVNAKLVGLYNVLSNINQSGLKKAVFFSSVTAYYGNIGQSDYALANATLNAVSKWLNTQGVDTTSVMWPPWEGGMTQGAVKAYFEKYDIQVMAPEMGSQAFVHLFTKSYQHIPEVIFTNNALDRYLGDKNESSR